MKKRSQGEKFTSIKNGIYYNNVLINLHDIINNSPSIWTEPEWGFPKGRRNYQEKDLACALREFNEETDYSIDLLNIVNNIIPFEEIFSGSNYKSYKHKYYLAHMKETDIVKRVVVHNSEVSSLKWFTLDECKSVIRPYNLEKNNIICKIHNILQNYNLY